MSDDDQFEAMEERAVPGRSPEALVLRNRLASTMAAGLWGVFAVIALAVPLNLLVSKESVDAVLIPSGIATFAYTVWRASRIELRIDAEGVWMRNMLRTYSTSWEQMADIMATQGLLPYVTAVSFGLKQRSRIKHLRVSISAQATQPGGRSEARRMCLELLRRRAREHEILFQLTLEGNLFRRPANAPWPNTPDDARRLAREQAHREEDKPPDAVPTRSEPRAAPSSGSDKTTKPSFSFPRFIGACLLFGPIIAGSILFGDIDPGTLGAVAAILVSITAIALVYDRRSAARDKT